MRDEAEQPSAGIDCDPTCLDPVNALFLRLSMPGPSFRVLPGGAEKKTRRLHVSCGEPHEQMFMLVGRARGGCISVRSRAAAVYLYLYPCMCVASGFSVVGPGHPRVRTAHFGTPTSAHFDTP